MIFIDGDFKSGKGDCKYHCSPTCHPAQVGPGWKYGCTHKAWWSNKAGDFVPIVKCSGKKKKCELKNSRCLNYYKRGLSQRIKNARNKIEKWEKLLNEIKELEEK
ncbi:hypothetical protein A2Z67_06070 [Candidatus Woesebacteria bacterium RBG_13_36_22]|uniref:Uncharacterized protein n=1 Tax=Candidatus Woesebacteria bacterium RBG_13_36_22 TaxID=1802478 RepID=A0A1F7X1K6_9BACT|nr:MAG: hypothetical protein A2Z67_06070 [Candidatus Woesebacteria bacterium RBG_13_36_22]